MGAESGDVHGRWRFDFHGDPAAADSAMEDRHDPTLSCAMTVLAAAKQARLRGIRAAVGRLETTPGEPDRVPARASAWLDAYAAEEGDLAAYLAEVSAQASARAARDGTRLDVVAEIVPRSDRPGP